VYVKSIDSSIHSVANVQVGDTLVTVNGLDVFGKSLSTLRNLIPGPEGSSVRLGFCRGGKKIHEGDFTRYSPLVGKVVPIKKTAVQQPIPDWSYVSMPAAKAASDDGDLKGTQV
jgi:C-terminal processing protease CtpA/Prc